MVAACESFPFPCHTWTSRHLVRALVQIQPCERHESDLTHFLPRCGEQRAVLCCSAPQQCCIACCRHSIHDVCCPSGVLAPRNPHSRAGTHHGWLTDLTARARCYPSCASQPTPGCSARFSTPMSGLIASPKHSAKAVPAWRTRWRCTTRRLRALGNAYLHRCCRCCERHCLCSGNQMQALKHDASHPGFCWTRFVGLQLSWRW